MSRLWKLLVLCIVSALVFPSTAMGAWSTPVCWEHNTAGVERMPWLVGRTLFYAKSYDIYQSVFDGETWSDPEPVPGKINTSVNEINPAVIKGGTVMYFLRYMDTTDYDFYRSEWDTELGEWGEPVRIDVWSTDIQDWDVWVSEDDMSAYLTTKGAYGDAVSLGGRDIWYSERQDGEWSIPVNVGPPINSAKDEWSVFVDQEGRIYFDSNREGGSGNYDIWVAEGWEGPVTNVTELNSAAPEREIAIDGDLAVFSADRREGGVGGYDLWVSTLE
ncbi:MAG: hypothetical protein ACOX4G_06350 [Limnochordia bacterium]|jgi:hypothetical protein